MKLWHLKGKKILIVDDFYEMRSLTQSMLLPYTPDRIETARDGEEAIELMQDIKFDIVLCDYNLGNGKDGQQILEEARHRSLIPFSCIYIMITAENTSRMVMGAIDYLPDDYISKPFTRTQLQSRLQKLMEKKESLLDISAAIEKKDYMRALALCLKKLGENSSKRMPLLKTRTDIMMRLGRYEEVIESCDILLEERDIPWARLAMGQACFALERYHDAEDIFESMTEDNPANALAHDHLALTLEKIGNNKKAEACVNKAISISPKSILRQRKLGELAYKNENYSVSEQAFKEAVDIGRNSCFRKPEDYTHVAKCMIQRKASTEALKFIDSLEFEFGESNLEAQFHSALAEGLAYRQLGDQEKSVAAIARALENVSDIGEKLSTESALDLAESCLALGKTELANGLVKTLVCNNHDDDDILNMTLKMYENAGLGSEGESLVNDAREEVIRVNNEGARLLKEGKLEESIELFMEAARGMPDNVVINLNTAYSMIKQMEQTGLVNKYSRRATKYLDKVYRLDPANEKYFQLMNTLQKLSAKAA